MHADFMLMLFMPPCGATPFSMLPPPLMPLIFAFHAAFDAAACRRCRQYHVVIAMLLVTPCRLADATMMFMPLMR